MKFFNTLGRKLEEFKPIKEGEVSFYSCGPTVYNYVHVGNLRAYMFNDLLRRYLEFSGFKVKHVMNLTDVDDKTILGSRDEGKSLKEFTEFYSQEFLADIAKVNILEPTKVTKATDYIPQMVKLIKDLEAKGLAYEKNGSWYYKISDFADYGHLACLDHQELKHNADERLNDADEYEKEGVNDFALWKAWSEDDGDVFWENELGKGRPGWHIECSVMSTAELGDHFDIHAGGEDLIFPHHTNEIAQSEGATGKKFVNYWLHNAHLLVNGEKMSKSLDNFYTLKDLKEKGIHPMVIRFTLLKTHYRQLLDFNFDFFDEAKLTIEKFVELLANLEEVNGGGVDVDGLIGEAEKKFKEAMDDDLNISGGIAVAFDFMNEVNKLLPKLNKEDATKVRDFIYKLDSVFGFIETVYDEYKKKLEKVRGDDAVKGKIDERAKAREAKDFDTSDKIRDELAEDGIVVKDVASGTMIALKNYL